MLIQPRGITLTAGMLGVLSLVLSGEGRGLGAQDRPPGALIQAVRAADLSTVNALIAEGAPVNAPDAAGITPLVHAVGQAQAQIATALLDAGADVNAAITNGVTALHVAAASDSGIVRLLLERGATVDARGNNGVTPLQVAIARGAEGNVELLLQHGASVDHEGDAGDAVGVAVLRWDAAPQDNRDKERRIASRVAEAAGLNTNAPLPARVERAVAGAGSLTRAQGLLAKLGFAVTADGQTGPATDAAIAAFRSANPQSGAEAVTDLLLEDLDVATAPYEIRPPGGGELRPVDVRCQFKLRRTLDRHPVVVGGCRSDITESRRAGLAEMIVVNLWAVRPGKERDVVLLMSGQGLVSGSRNLPQR